MSLPRTAGAVHAPGVRAASIRVALSATLIVAAMYLVLSAAVFAIVTRNLTGQVDDRLRDTISHVTGGPGAVRGGGHGPFEPPPRPEGPFGQPVIVWTMYPDGSVGTSPDEAPLLPAEDREVTGPETITIPNESTSVSVRAMGAPVGNAYVVVGTTLDSVAQAQQTLLIAEIAIAPALLLAVFLGAVAIGRRVAAPIERARQRQLEFTADASHELRTPLAVIEAQTSLALSTERSATWYRTAFGRVELESHRMRRLVEDMLWLARFDAMAQHPSAEPVDLAVLAAQSVDRFRSVAETRYLALALHVDEGANVVSVPPEWLDRLLGVLLDNACKYSPEGGAVSVTVGGDGGRVRVSVDDSGPGIPADQRPLIFDRFHRATDVPGGAGLGLAIADAIVRATNGRWRIGVAPAGGASLSVAWPRSFGQSRESAGAAAHTKAAQSG